MVGSSSESAVGRLNLTKTAETPLAEVGSAKQSDQTPMPFELPETCVPNSPRSRDAGVVVRLFPTPPQIFGISPTQPVKRDDPTDGDSAATLEESGLRPLEAVSLSLSRMLKSLQPLETFPGFPTPGLSPEPGSSASSRDAHSRPSVEISQTVLAESSGIIQEQTGLRSDRGLPVSAKDGSDSLDSGSYANTHSPTPKSPKSRRRIHGLSHSSMGSTPSSSIGSASELQFPSVDLRSPPSPEPLGIARPGSPLKWRSRSSAVSPVEDSFISNGSQETPVQGLVGRNPSFSEFMGSNISGQVLFGDTKKKPDWPDPVRVEPPVRKLKAVLDVDEDALLSSMIPQGAPSLDSNDLNYSFALEYNGPPIDHAVPKVEPMDVRSLRYSTESRQSVTPPSPTYNGKGTAPSNRRISVSLTNPFPAWFNNDRERNQREVPSPSSSSGKSVGRDSTAIPSSPRSRTPPLALSENIDWERSTLPPELARILLDEEQAELPAPLTSSPVAGPQGSNRTLEGTSDEESEFASKVGSPRPSISRSFGSHASDNTLGRSEQMGSWKVQSTLGFSGEESGRQSGQRSRSMSLPGIQAIGSQAVGSHLTPTKLENLSGPLTTQRRKGECYLCHRGNRLTEKESCLVCNSKYCYNCVLVAMESMPEGRKCQTCIGKPVDEVKRPSIGKPSRLLNRLLSPQEVQQIMKAEKECAANQLRPEQLFVNGRQLTAEELAVLLKCPIPPQKLKPGRYWYDSQSGLWGKEGEKPDKLISAGVKVGGALQENASNGSSQVYMNGRELGKLELKMLKLAGVHCPPSTHLWVDSDGSYQEEGQNNSKGNIWNKTSIRFLYPFFSLPTPGASGRYTKDIPRDAPDIYMPDCVMQNKLHKILVLGHEGSGRSTLFKQTKFLFKDGFTREERLKTKSMIQRNIYRYISILLEGRERFEEEEEELAVNSRVYAAGDYAGDIPGTRGNIYVLDTRLKQRAEWFLEMMAEGSLETFFSASSNEHPPLVDELWRDPAIKATHKRKDELGALPDAADYFLNKVMDISSNDYLPTDEDILRAEGLAQGSGLAEIEFSLDDKMPSYQDHDIPSSGRYQLIKVGGKGFGEGCKWLDMFEDVHAVVFCVAISEYDQVLTDSDGSTYSKLRQKDLFESVLKHPILGEKPMVLFLNKYDLFEEKICKGIPLTSCEWFSDFRPVGASQMTAQMQAQQGYTYVVHKYKELFAGSGHKLFTFKLNAIERDKVLEAFQYVREILKWRDNGWDIFPEESSYSTDLSSYSQQMVPPPGQGAFLFDRGSRRSLEL